MLRPAILASILLFSSLTAFGQLPVPICDREKASIASCAESECKPFSSSRISTLVSIENSAPNALRVKAADSASDFNSPAAPSAKDEREGFHWGRALEESLTFLAIEQAYVVHTDFRWVVSENGIPFNHYWRDYMQSLSAWTKSGWSDGDPNMFGYVGHPIQGALTSFIEIQNDPKSRGIEFSNTKRYWKSRLKATIWNAVYSTQWNLGPISEVTVEKYGTKDRPPWNQNGSWPCTTKNCYTGVGQIDIVMTPIGGFGWMVGEDWMDKNIARRVEGATSNRFLIDTVRCTFNPIRAGANILHGNKPWFRFRDTDDWKSYSQQ